MRPVAYIRYLAYDNFKEPWEQKIRVIPDHEILYIVSGSGEYTVDGVVHSFGPGQLLFVESGVKHSQRSITLPLVLWCIHFDLYAGAEDSPCPEIAGGGSIRGCFFSGRGYGEQLTLMRQYIRLPPVITPEPGSLTALHLSRMTALLREMNREDFVRVEQLLPEILEALQAPDATARRDSLYVILTYIEEHYREPLSLSDIAQQLHLQPGYVGQLFKKRMGLSLSEYLCLYRISAAKGLLRYTDEKLEEIALSCGFYDASHFCRVFQGREGGSPTEYRKKFRKE